MDDEITPDSINAPRWVYDDPHSRTVMSAINTAGPDLAQNVFRVQGADGT